MASLAYLSDIPIERVQGLTGKRGDDIRKAGLGSVTDLLLHAPRRYVDRSLTVPIAEAPVGKEVTVIGTVEAVSLRRARAKLIIVEATVSDPSATLTVTWFNQAFRERQLNIGVEVALSGKVEDSRGRLQMKMPDVVVLDKPGESLTTGRVMPVHPTIGGVGPGHLRRAVHNALKRSRPVTDPLPAEMIDRLGLVDRDTAIGDLHFPSDLEAADRARDRLVFDELFRLEVALAMRKHRQVSESVGIEHSLAGGLVDAFIEALPYTLTSAQQRAIDELQADMAASQPMHRLLQGEVGSGKTVVAMAALLTAVQGGYQAAVMAPTEVLADQHYLGLEPLASLVGVRMALLTGSSADRQVILDRAASGEVDIVIGTHALIQDGVAFANLGAAVVDEQHRFGVHQRVMLKDKADGPTPDLLIMTATPIPRTLAMTLYGDLDVTAIDEMPKGRVPVETAVVAKSPRKVAAVHDLIRKEVAAGRQAFVVCPLVEDSAKLEAVSATAEHERLSTVFADLRVGLLHGQMRSAEKEEVMGRMRAGEIDVLVATTVIEVGIDIPNATVMVVEDADRFGLSQLHQLRGRVGRGEHPGRCILIADPTTDEGKARLAAMAATTDGFRLAEEDLRIRGQGTVFGAKQAGIADLRLANILDDFETLVSARREGFDLVAHDPDLDKHPDLLEEVKALLGDAAEWLLIS